MAVELERCVQLVFDLNDELRRIVDILEETEARGAKRAVRMARRCSSAPAPAPDHPSRAILSAETRLTFSGSATNFPPR